MNQGEDLGVAGVCIVGEVPGVALGSREVVSSIEAVAGDGRVHFRGRVIWHKSVAYAGADLALGPVLGDVQGIDCPGDHAVHLGLAIGLRPLVVIREVDASHRRGYEAVHLSCGAVVGQRGRYEAVDPCGGTVVSQRGCYEPVDFCCGAEGHQCRSYGSISLGRSLVEQQGGSDGSCDRCICLGNAVSVAGQGQREIVILHADAQRCCGVQIADLVCPNQPIPGNFPKPGLRVDQIGSAACCQGG